MRGQRLTMDASFGRWGTQTLIARLSQDALFAPWVIKGAMNGPAFAAYVREVLVPEIEPRTVVILVNLATHKNKEAAAALQAHGCWFLFLSPPSLDMNPIKQAISKLKAHLRRIGARTFTDVFEAIGKNLRSLRSPRMLELLQGCRIRRRFKPKGFKALKSTF